MLSSNHESEFGVVELDTPFAASDDMECIRCWYRVAYCLQIGVSGEWSHPFVSPT
jgi:hypothetical protein